MKLLIQPHFMEIGGSQLNAIELGAKAQAAGHEVTVFGTDGPLVSRVRELGLEYLYTPLESSWPSLRVMNRLCEVVRKRGIDLVHAYEQAPAVDLAYGPHLRLGVPMVITILSMRIPRTIPTHVPLIVGTQELADEARRRFREVHLLEPPIDTDLNARTDPRAARRRFGVTDDEYLLAIVCRVTPDLDKLGGILEAITAVEHLSDRHPVRLLVAGEGPGEAEVRRRAAEVNTVTGRETVIVTGGLLDPRPAYDAADVVLGMGSSAMKGMAFGKPLVVQGRAGFWRLLTDESAPVFLHQGWFGQGDGNGLHVLEKTLEALLADPAGLPRFGAFGRQLVVERFSLTEAARRMEDIYRAALDHAPSRAHIAGQLVKPLFTAAEYKSRPAVRRLRARAGTREAQRFPSGSPHAAGMQR